jgi:hypothetical protein
VAKAWAQLDLPLPHLLALLERDLLLDGGKPSAEATELIDRLGAKGVQALTRRARGTAATRPE